MRRKPYRTIGLGGTFDHLHAGHMAFIKFAANLADQLIIEVTDQVLVQQKGFPESIEPLRVRKHAVTQFCKQQKYRCEIQTLYDVYGTTLDPEARIEALAVTEETVAGAQKINKTREKLNLFTLPVHVFPLVYDNLKQHHIHSLRIRRGEISRRGEVFSSAFDSTVTLTPEQRAFFAEPQGELYTEDTISDAPDVNIPLRIVIGDASLEHFTSQKWSYSVGIFDDHKKKEPSDEPLSKKISPNLTVKNPAGSITPELAAAVELTVTAALKDRSESSKPTPQHLFVEGEEDLAAVAAVLSAPLGSEVWYGQPDHGLMRIVVTERHKYSFFNVLTKSSSSQ